MPGERRVPVDDAAAAAGIGAAGPVGFAVGVGPARPAPAVAARAPAPAEPPAAAVSPAAQGQGQGHGLVYAGHLPEKIARLLQQQKELDDRRMQAYQMQVSEVKSAC